MKFINFTIIRFSVFLSLGIFASYSFQNSIIPYFIIFTICFLFLGISWIIARKQLFQTPYFGILTYASFFFLGGSLVQKQLPEFQKNHYSSLLENTSTIKKDYSLTELKIKEVLKPDLYNFKYIGEIITINGVKTNGKILLIIPINNSLKTLTIDDLILTNSSISEIRKPLNPHQFDYAKYMRLLGVYHQIRAFEDELLFHKKGTSSLRGLAENSRNHIIKKLKSHAFNPKELSIIQALLLGQKRDIDKDVYKNYAAAGAIHILAVSGLHVGILYLIISFILRFIEALPKGKPLKSILILIILWGFALIAGLSPSVVRAVSMFSFFAIAQSLERPTNSFNTLFLSYFFLLLMKPLWLFHIGFQMSYLAVFFIIWVQPKLYKYYVPKFYVDKLIWSILTVTFSAQLGILPLSIYYFHQFPGLSFITNLVILPFLGIILGGGILIIVLALFNNLPNVFTTLYNYLIELLNSFISRVAHQEQFVIQDIFFSEGKLITSYILIICVILYWKKRTILKLKYVFISLIFFLGNHIWDVKTTSKNQMIIFNKNRKTLIGFKEGKSLRVFNNDTLKNYKNDYPIKGYRISENIKNYSEHSLLKTWAYHHKNIVVIDSLGVYPNSKKIAIVLLIKNPKINLNRLIDSMKPKLIITNGSNYPYLKKQWKNTCYKREISFYDISEKGAFILE